MTKPIFIIRFPRSIILEDQVSAISGMNKMGEAKFPDYSTLAIPQINEESDWEFEMFNGENITDIQFEELKKKVLEYADELIEK